jgi:hypothetical protein
MRVRALFLLLFTLCAFATEAHSQSKVMGQIRDAKTEEFLGGVVVTQVGQTGGAVTDSLGHFSLSVVGKYPVLKLQYLGYETLQQNLDLSKGLWYNFYMTEDPFVLPTTTITAGELQTVHPNKKATIIDYEFLEDKILMVVFDPNRKHNVLQLFSDDLRQLTEVDDPFDPPTALETDCMGAKQCISKRFAAQIDYRYESLILRKDSIETYHRVMSPCLASLDSTYFFADDPNAHTRRFFYIDQTERKYHLLYATIDSNARRTIQDEEAMMKISSPLASVGIESSEGSRHQMRQDFQSGLNQRYLYTVQAPPSYVPIKVIANKIRIFDHIQSRIVTFDANGELLDKVAIDYPKMKFWKREIFTDDAHQKAFTLSEKDGYTTVHEIDLTNGKLADHWELPKQFVRKVMVRNGFIYFLYRDNIYDPINRLYRLRL